MGVTAIFELPVPIWISTTIMGERIGTAFGPLEFDVVMPGADGAVGTPPALDGIAFPLQKPGSDELLVWAQRFAAYTPGAESESTALCRIVLQTHNSREADIDRFELSTVVNPWFDAVRTWVEALTGQDLDPNHRVYSAVVYGTNLLFIDPPRDGDGPTRMRLTTPQILPASAEVWRNVLSRVSAGDEIPLEEQLSRDSRAAFARGQLRRSVIDAASAAEIVLHRVIGSQASPDALPNRRLRQKLDSLDKQPLGGLVTLARESHLDLDIDLDALEELAEVRNDAIHRGETPESDRASGTVQAAIDLLAAHGLWKR